ncbi:MAG: fibro-slime domain-containing protein [Planctomycetota bacterium]|nr:fibro-slime domain-containing protein [Planctomycetota bacterium]
MQPRQASTIFSSESSHRAILLIAILAFFMAELILSQNTLARQAGPDVIHVPGIVRDFRRDHPDFNVVPGAGYGHYAGNLALNLDASYRPQFTGAGFQVGSQWTDKYTNPIAPHLYSPGVFVPLVSSPFVDTNATFDSYDPTTGVYDMSTAGGTPQVITGSTMPPVLAPPPMPPLVDTIQLSGSVISFLSADLHCNNFIVDTSHKLVINGDISMLVENSFLMRDISSVVEIPDGSSLTIFIKGSFIMKDQASLNTSDHPERVVIINLGTQPIRLLNQASLSAHVISPDAALDLVNGAQIFGRFAGESVNLTNGAKFHLDQWGALTTCGDSIVDLPGAASAADPGGITSAATFNQWYNDVLGTNLSQLHTIKLMNDGTGLYEAILPEFHPIDDRLFGNEGDAHNYFFTYTFNATITYESCTNQFFALGGADDMWLFIDGKLAIDLGGVIANTPQVVELDRLNLTDGDTYSIQFFYAQRNPTTSTFNFRTNIVVQPTVLVAAGTASYD